MPRKLMLVDGSNQAFRAYHAIRSDMRSPDGFPTRALYGFTMVLQKLVADHQPDMVLVVFDKGKSFRNEIYPAYKGQRPDMPEDLRQQWPEFMPLCEAWGISACARQGYEADDIIGTLAATHAGPELKVWIASSDKDFAQLVSEHVHLLDLAKGLDLGPAEVEAKWGVPPERMLDLLSLMGDTSDNVPGIKGVGPKKAASFIQRFGDAAGVLAHADEIGGKTGQRVAESADAVDLARRLITIVTDVPEVPSLDELVRREPDLPALEALLTRYNFRRQLAWVRERLGAPPAESGIDRGDYRVVQTAAELDELVTVLRSAGRFAYDSETTSLDPRQAQLVGMSFCWGEADAVYVPIAHEGEGNCPGALDALLPLLADDSLKKTGQNLKFDLEVLRALGHGLAGIDGDTMLADYLLAVDRRHGLDELALRHLDHRVIPYKEVTKDVDGEFARVPVDQAGLYAAEDAHIAWLLDQRFAEPLSTQELLPVYRDIEVPLIPVLADMELTGIGVDRAALVALGTELGERVEALRALVHEEAGEEFNVNSTQQLAVILFEKRGLKPGKKTKKGYSTDARTLNGLAGQGDRLCQLILDYREVAKLKSTYVDALPRVIADDGRIHTSFHQAVAATGRLASHDPNLQNIPIRTAEGRRIRACFVPDPGYRFLSADYSQVELRVLAHLCGEGTLRSAFVAGEDIHRRTAAEVFGGSPALVSAEQRRAAKAINFGIIYGMSAFRLSGELGIPRREAQRIIDAYFDRYPEVRAYVDRAVADAKERGYAQTLFGRRRPVHGLDARNANDRGAAERIAVNTPVQGTAADVIKIAMLRVHARLAREHPTSRLLLQVHDELVLAVPEAELGAVRVAVVEEMEAAATLSVPLVVDTGDGATWDAAH